MPYGNYRGRRRTYGRRRRYRRKPAKPVRYQVADTAYQAYQMGRKALSLLNTEFKHHDLAIGPSTVGQAAGFNTLNNIAQGDTTLTRDGRSISIKSISLKGSMQTNASGLSAIRIMLVEKKHNNNLALSSADLFDSTSTLLVNAFYNLDNVPQNVTIHFDQIFNLDPEFKPRLQLNRTFTFENKHTKYAIGTTSGAVTTIETSAFYLIFVSSEATNIPTVDFSTRVRFLDN